MTTPRILVVALVVLFECHAGFRVSALLGALRPFWFNYKVRGTKPQLPYLAELASYIGTDREQVFLKSIVRK